MSEDILKDFENPGAEWRGKPFWSWNGILDKEETLRQVDVMKEMGLGGYFMHSRTGLATEYLGPEWFECINACADQGEKLGMESWLYDEDRWPSGTAGGMVTQDPHFRQKFLRCQPIAADEFVWKDQIIVAFACEMEGINYRNAQRLEPGCSVEQYAGQTILAFTTEEQAKSSFYNGYTYLDTLNRAATDKFIEMTHDKYAKECGDRLGKSIKGIFTDEPHRGPLMDGFSLSNPEPHWVVPWTYDLFIEFEKRFGYDLVDRLPELFLRLNGEVVSPVKWHFVELLQQLFLENFAKPCDDWCRAHDLILTGHILHEDSLTAQTAVSGSVVRYYEYMEYPGVDVLTEGNPNFWICKQIQSAARQLGRKWLLSELYGCTGWQMPFEAHKSVGDWQALFGINLRCHHLSWYTMEGEAKRDFPASILHQSAWYPDYDYVESYFARFGVVMSAGEAVCDLMVVNPVESVWCQIYPGWSRMLNAHSTGVQALENEYRNTFHALAGAQLDFDYADEDWIARMGSIETGEDGVRLRIGQASYKAVLVSGMTTVRSTTLDLIEQFSEAGGTVLFAGAAPEYVDALPSERADDLAASSRQIPAQPDAIAQACIDAVGHPVLVEDPEADHRIPKIFCQVRQVEDERYICILNVDRENAYKNARIQICGEGQLEEWDCATGQRWAVDAEVSQGHLICRADFAPSALRVFVLKQQRDAELPPRPRMKTIHTDVVHGPWQYELAEPNVCVLDYARYQIDDGEWNEEREVLKIDREVRSHFGLPWRGGEMLQPWFTKQQGYERLGNLILQFKFAIEQIPETPVEVAMETPEVFRMMVNDMFVDTTQKTDWWCDPCFRRIRIPQECLKQGTNVLEVQVDFDQGINLETLYLLGEFGVRVEGAKRVLTALPETVESGTLTEQGFPFYGAGITYTIPITTRPKPGESLCLTLPGWEGACAKVHVPDADAPRMIAWQPYEADITDMPGGRVKVEVVLTRRNTFGPLHQIPLRAPGYGPDNWLTEGEAWSDDYMFWPAGILEPVAIERRWSKKGC